MVSSAAHPDPASPWQRPGVRRLAGGQGWFYLVTGLWPVLHLPSFYAVTGPKVDGWLVQTVGALIAVTGFVLIRAARRHRVTSDLALLAAGQAAALAAIDVIFVARGRISAIYLGDAVVEGGLILAWWVLSRRPSPAPPPR
ncbi:MAG TPA: hypothetical protein VHF69_03105 [Candidatus Synoicihabitans sp.]|nr:hypothetical protein [Candidatus Synoicihabitans sp.]